MELKRTILAVVLSMAVLVFFQNYMRPKKPVTGTPGQAVQGETAGQGPASREAPAATARQQTPAATPAPPPAAPEQLRRAVLENDQVRIETSTRAGAVVSAKLKQYKDRIGPDAQPVELLSAPSGLDIVGATRLVDAALPWDAIYTEVEKAPGRVVYAWDAPNGLKIVKTYTLPSEGYALDLTVEVRNPGPRAARDRLGLVMVEDFSGAQKDRLSRYNFAGPAYYAGEKFEEVKLKKLPEGVQVPGPVSWAALVKGYFLMAALPEDEPAGGLRLAAYRGLEKVAEVELTSPVFELGAGQSFTVRYRIYTGPKQQEALAPLGAHLTDVIHYGFFHPIAMPLLWFLKAIYRITGNYGIAIIVLTVLVKILFWPLSARSFRSMQKMKEIQPKLQRLKEKYGNDKERLNREVMQLYKTHKVNPMGGCLPMIVQIPVFFALYRILLGSIELRHAPFMLWIQDLSAKDPYYVTPVLMGVTMFLQQKMTPVTGTNEGQMKMMMYGMPIVFTFLFLNFPSGLVIYWLVNNILSVAQQALMLRKSRSPEAA